LIRRYVFIVSVADVYVYFVGREVIIFVDRFTALRFTETGATPAARPILIVLMNQHALRPITFGMK
jgi:hypothetical protein